MLKNNYHTHTYLCRHAEGMVKDYAKVASDYGFLELGMSDHGPVLKEFMSLEEAKRSHVDTASMDYSEIDMYLKQIEEAKMLYPNLKILSGFETEFLEDRIEYYKELRSKADYLNLGIHFFRLNGKIVDTYLDMNYTNLNDYVNNAENALKSGLYTTFCHPDLFMFDYKDKNGNRCFDEECVKATRRICELALKYDVYLEVNCNGLKYAINRSNYNGWRYPYPDFWKIVKEYPVKIIVGADAHTPSSLVNTNVTTALEFVKNLGLNVLDKMEIKK